MNSNLSKRELQILILITEELTTSEIGKKLHLSKSTVESHRCKILNKFGVRNTAGMVRRAFELGLINANQNAYVSKTN